MITGSAELLLCAAKMSVADSAQGLAAQVRSVNDDDDSSHTPACSTKQIVGHFLVIILIKSLILFNVCPFTSENVP